MTDTLPSSNTLAESPPGIEASGFGYLLVVGHKFAVFKKLAVVSRELDLKCLWILSERPEAAPWTDPPSSKRRGPGTWLMSLSTPTIYERLVRRSGEK